MLVYVWSEVQESYYHVIGNTQGSWNSACPIFLSSLTQTHPRSEEKDKVVVSFHANIFISFSVAHLTLVILYFPVVNSFATLCLVCFFHVIQAPSPHPRSPILYCRQIYASFVLVLGECVCCQFPACVSLAPCRNTKVTLPSVDWLPDWLIP